jgi:hypothetical protein
MDEIHEGNLICLRVYHLELKKAGNNCVGGYDF